MTVIEDLGPATVGSVLAAGITLVDDGIIAANNNNSIETVIRTQLIGLELAQHRSKENPGRFWKHLYH
jgi:hypothetical protein